LEFIFSFKGKIMAKKLLIALRNRKESGASMLEYALLAALIAIACIATIQTLGSAISTKFSQITTALTAAS
jgi:pilus assembly protein Flp/PilA